MEVLKNSENLQRSQQLSSPTKALISPRNNNTTNNSTSNNKATGNTYTKAFGCNFDTDATKLYLSIQLRKWDEATARANAHPNETKTWVSRYEDSGNLRWRLLPLHAAIIFKAPLNTIRALLLSYPRAARHKDDQGMLPIHLAFRNESPVAVVQMLLMSYPQSIAVQDRKGREPAVIVQNSRSVLKDQYEEALDLATGFHAVAIAAVESDMMHNFRKKAAVGTLEFDAEKINLVAKIDMLELELNNAQGASEVLVNHVNSLESQMCSKHDTESYLASKVGKIDNELKEVTQAKVLAEAQLFRERKKLMRENDKLTAECEDLREIVQNAGDKDRSTTESIEIELKGKNSMVDRMRNMEKENQECKREVEEMETLLKKKIESEHSLANQVSSLAARLAESTTDTFTSTNAFQKRIDTLTKEKLALKTNVENLNVRVKSVLQSFDYMAKEHDRILKLSTMHQETVQSAMQHQESLAINAARNEQIMIDAAWEREEIVRILTLQAKQVEKTSEERKALMGVVKVQTEKMVEVAANRTMLVDSIQEQQGNIATLQKDIDVLRRATSEDLSFLSEGDCDDDDDQSVDTITPTITTIGKKGGAQLWTRTGVSNDDSEISGIEPNDSTDDVDQSYDEEQIHDEIDQMMPSNSSLASDDDLVGDDDSAVDEDHDENDLTLAEIESNVDKICNEAARLVASMPVKKPW